MTDNINHPTHYQADGMEAIDVIDAYFTNNFNLGNVFKYISHAGKKGDHIEDLKKAAFYLNQEIEQAEKERLNSFAK